MAQAAGTSSLPRDPDEALRFGLRTIEAAYEEKTRHLDHELCVPAASSAPLPRPLSSHGASLHLRSRPRRQQVRAYSKQQQSQLSAMERRIAELEQQARDSDERARQLTDEKALLQQELKTTQRDLSKLDSFKRNIMQSIHDEDVPGAGLGAMGAAAAFGGAVPAASSGTSEYTPACGGAPTPFGPGSPAPTVGGHPLGLASGGACTGGGSFAASAGRSAYGSASPAMPSQPGSPPGGETNVAAVMDGKDFFRQARLRLTYEQFNQFLSNIKRLNDHAQTRDETLARAQEIFGVDNGDLFISFKTLLSKHGLT